MRQLAQLQRMQQLPDQDETAHCHEVPHGGDGCRGTVSEHPHHHDGRGARKRRHELWDPAGCCRKEDFQMKSVWVVVVVVDLLDLGDWVQGFEVALGLELVVVLLLAEEQPDWGFVLTQLGLAGEQLGPELEAAVVELGVVEPNAAEPQERSPVVVGPRVVAVSRPVWAGSFHLEAAEQLAALLPVAGCQAFAALAVFGEPVAGKPVERPFAALVTVGPLAAVFQPFGQAVVEWFVERAVVEPVVEQTVAAWAAVVADPVEEMAVVVVEQVVFVEQQLVGLLETVGRLGAFAQQLAELLVVAVVEEQLAFVEQQVVD